MCSFQSKVPNKKLKKLDQTKSIKFWWNTPDAEEKEVFEAYYDIMVSRNIGDGDDEKEDKFKYWWLNYRKNCRDKVAKRISQFMNWLQTKNTYWRASLGSFMKNDTK